MRRGAALVCIQLLAACASPPDGERSTSVVDLVRQVDRRVVRRWTKPPKLAEARPTVMMPRPLQRFVRRVALPGAAGAPDERLAILAPAGSRARFELVVPRAATLDLAFAVLTPSADRAMIDAEIRVSADGRAVKVLKERFDSARRGWEERSIDLSRWAGRSVRLTLGSAGGEGSGYLALATPLVTGPASATPPWSVILISLDTLRADHLGSYGYERPTSPHLDAFGTRSFRFSQAVSSAPWTRPAHNSLFTGLYPRSTAGLTRLPLALLLWQNGYYTSAIAGGGQLDYRLGFSRGFESYREGDWLRSPLATAEEIAQLVGRPFFSFLHTYEPHDPYIDTRFAADLPSGRFAGEFSSRIWQRVKRTLSPEEKRYVEALYDGDIAFTDERLGELLAALDELRVLDSTVVIITSDHGEQFWEHGTWRHGQNLYDHQLLVPLMIFVPERLRDRLGLPGNRVIAEPVRLIDIYPTILELLGVDAGHEVQGRSLVPFMAGNALPEEPAVAEDLNLDDEESKAVRYRGLKYISRFTDDGNESRELYELATDPREQRNVLAERELEAERLRGYLERLTGSEWWRESPSTRTEGELPDDLRRRLEALGYLGDRP